jgi:hypothetical protein
VESALYQSFGCSGRILEYRHRAARSCHCWYVAHSAESYPLACAADHKHNVLMPRYGFRLVTLMGEKENRPDVCQGIRHVPTPCSIALMIASVTLRYTSRFSVVVESMLDIVKCPFALFRGCVRVMTSRSPDSF